MSEPEMLDTRLVGAVFHDLLDYTLGLSVMGWPTGLSDREAIYYAAKRLGLDLADYHAREVDRSDRG